MNGCEKLQVICHTNRHIQMLSFSVMEQKIRGDCIIHLPPSRVLRFLPYAPSAICDVPPSIITHSHFVSKPLLKLWNDVPLKDVLGIRTCVNKLKTCSWSIFLMRLDLRHVCGTVCPYSKTIETTIFITFIIRHKIYCYIAVSLLVGEILALENWFSKK